MIEIWRTHPTYTDYEISDLGGVRRRTGGTSGSRRGLVKKPTLSPSGYLRVTLQVNRKQMLRRVHVLVLETFVGPRPPRMDGCHNDGDKLNNVLSNLRWATRKENMADARRHGTDCHGERHPHARITWDIVREMRRLRATTSMTYAEIASATGATKSQATDVCRGYSWIER